MSVCNRLAIKTLMIWQEVIGLIRIRGDSVSTLSSIFQLQVWINTETSSLQKL